MMQPETGNADSLGLAVTHLNASAGPVLTALFWLLYVPKAALVYRHALWWMAWPAAYAAYAFARGAWDGWFPYPFINAARLGWPVALRNAALLALAFLTVGLLLVWLCRSFARARATGVTAGASSG